MGEDTFHAFKDICGVLRNISVILAFQFCNLASLHRYSQLMRAYLILERLYRSQRGFQHHERIYIRSVIDGARVIEADARQTSACCAI